MLQGRTPEKAENFIVKGADNRLVEFVVINNKPKSVVQEIVCTFFQTGFLHREVLFSGHGNENGQLILCPAKEEEENPAVVERAFDRKEFDLWMDTSASFLPGTPGNMIVNSCHSHQFAKASSSAERGLRVVGVTDERHPEAPAGGLIEIIHNTPDKIPWLTKAIGDLTDFPKPSSLNPAELLRKYHPSWQPTFKFRNIEEPQPKEPGLYMFPASCGDTYLLLFGDQTALLIDSGNKPKLFANCCWNNFMVKYVRSFSALVTHVDKDHIQGLLYLVHAEDFQKGQAFPKCTKLWINCPATTRASYNDGQLIVISIISFQVMKEDRQPPVRIMLIIFFPLAIVILGVAKSMRSSTIITGDVIMIQDLLPLRFVSGETFLPTYMTCSRSPIF